MGEGGSGGKSLVIKVTTNSYLSDCDYGLNDFHVKMFRIPGELDPVTLEFWFLNHAEYQAMRDQYIHSADMYVIVYSTTNRLSFEELKFHLQTIYRVTDRGDVPIMVVGCKIDQEEEREVMRAEGENWVSLHEGVLFGETSAKTGQNVEDVFCRLAQRCLECERRRYGLGPKDEGYWVDPPEVQEVAPIMGQSVKRAR